MRRYLQPSLAVLSLLLALSLLVLLLTTLTDFYFYPLRLGSWSLLFRSYHGLLHITFFPTSQWLPVASTVDYSYTFLGIGLTRQIAPAYTLHLPHLLLILLLFIHPLLFFRRNKFFLTPRHERLAPNQCPTCAYDLRMHRPGQKCPECGTPVPAPKSTNAQ